MTTILTRDAFWEAFLAYLKTGSTTVTWHPHQHELNSMSEIATVLAADQTKPGMMQFATEAEAIVASSGSKALSPTTGLAMISQLIPISFTGRDNVGACTATGLAPGDTVIGVTGLSTMGIASASFEATITVGNQIQQTDTGNLSAANFLALVYHPLGSSPSVSPSVSPSLSPSFSVSRSTSRSVSRSVSPSVSSSESASNSPTLSASASVSNSVSASISGSASVSASRSISPSPSKSPSQSGSRSTSPSHSESISPSMSGSRSQSPSGSASMSLSPSASGSASNSPSLSPSGSASRSVSPSVSPSVSSSVSPSASASPSTG